MISTKEKNIVSKSKKSLKKIQIVSFGILLSVVTTIILFIIGFTIHKTTSEKAALFGIVICTAILIFVLSIWINPGNFFRYPALSAGDTWKSIPGIYSGSKSLLGTTISVEIELSSSGVMTLNFLNCEGSSCPTNSSSLIHNCSSKVISINKVKEKQGYSLTGDCIDELYKIKTSDKSSIINGIWIRRFDDTYYVLIYLHICGIPILGCINPQIEVKLEKQK